MYAYKLFKLKTEIAEAGKRNSTADRSMLISISDMIDTLLKDDEDFIRYKIAKYGANYKYADKDSKDSKD